jgi:hypothetical protein
MGPVSLMGTLMGQETSKNVHETSLEMAEMPWKCCLLYHMVFPDLETPYYMVDDVSKAFRTCFDISGCFGHWDVAKLGVSCNLDKK